MEDYITKKPFAQPVIEEVDEKHAETNVDHGWDDNEQHHEEEKPKVYDVQNANLDDAPNLEDL